MWSSFVFWCRLVRHFWDLRRVGVLRVDVNRFPDGGWVRVETFVPSVPRVREVVEPTAPVVVENPFEGLVARDA